MTRLFFGGLFIVIAVIGLAIFIGLTKSHVPIATLDRITVDTGLSMLIDSELSHFIEPERLFDPIWAAEVLISEVSYPSLESDLLAKKIDHTLVSGLLSTSTVWWKPKNIQMTRQYLANDHTLVNFVVSKESNLFHLYIECVIF